MARPRKPATDSGTLTQKNTAQNNEFRAGLRPSLEQEARDTARKLDNGDEFRSSQAKLALSEAKAAR